MYVLADAISGIFGGISLMGVITLFKLAKKEDIVITLIFLGMLTAVILTAQIVITKQVEEKALIKIELTPPTQEVAVWDTPNTSNNYTLMFRINILEMGEMEHSKVFDFGILIVEANSDGRDKTEVEPYKPDPISKQEYSIPINFLELIEKRRQ